MLASSSQVQNWQTLNWTKNCCYITAKSLNLNLNSSSKKGENLNQIL